MADIRLFTEEPLSPGGSLRLTGDQYHYLTNVMRCKIGDKVAFFNGRDGEWEGVLESQTKKAITIDLTEIRKEQTGVPNIHLLFAPIKRLRIDYLAQKATELGVAALGPVITERTMVTRINEVRLRANAIEAAEQTGRMCVPAILAARKLERCLEDWDVSRRLIFCDEAGDDPEEEWGGSQGRARPARQALEAFESDENAQKWAIVIGPEGGFSEQERTLLRSKPFVTPVSLGPRIMRADTAAIAALTLWQSILGDW